MFGISILLTAAALLNLLFNGFNAHNIFFTVISLLLFIYTTFFLKKQDNLVKRLAVPAALVILLLFTGLIFDPFREETSFASRYDRAIDLLDRSEFEKSMSLLEELEKEKSSDDQVALAQGILYLRMRSYDNSWSYLTKANTLNPYDVNIQFNMALNRYHKGNTQEAGKIFEALIERAPKLLKAHVYAGIINMELGNYIKAVYHFENARFLEPEAAPIYVYLAKCSIASMDYDTAKINLENALDNDPSKQLEDEINVLMSEIKPYVGGDDK
jgi:tetratricopeptide (TPR) repeat protein